MNLKKPRFWDYKKPNFISYSLWPITILVKILFFLKSKKKKNLKILKQSVLETFTLVEQEKLLLP